jgi:RNA polymerase sigma factor (sigma-70 family)
MKSVDEQAAEDEALVQRLKGGDASAVGPYLALKRPQLLAFIKKVTGDHLLKVVAIEDLYQEVATSAWSAFPKIANMELDPMAWLFQLTRRRISDAHRFHFGAQRRSQGRVVSIDGEGGDEKMSLQELLVSSITSPSMVVSRNFRLNRVQLALAELGEEISTIIRLRYVDGLSTSEIAERLHKSDVSIRVTLSRSLKKLSDTLGQQE